MEKRFVYSIFTGIGVILFVFIIAISLSLLMAYPFMWIWNYAVVSSITIANPITYWKSFWLMVFLNTIFPKYKTETK
jgi:hypothetical protein